MSEQTNVWKPERVEMLYMDENRQIICEAHSWLYPLRELRRVFIRGGSKANCYLCVAEVRRILKAQKAVR